MRPFTVLPDRHWCACAIAASTLGFLVPSGLGAQTIVGVGTTRLVTTNTTFPGSVDPLPPHGALDALRMDGGQLRVSDAATGQALTVTLHDAELLRGLINNPYNQTGVTALNFHGMTKLPGLPTAPLTSADLMVIRASAFDSRGLQVTNHGSFAQTGNGYLITQGPVQFNNIGNFDMQNDLGFQAGDFNGLGFKAFRNEGVFKKTSGTGTSVISAMFHQDGGEVEVHTGSVSFANGGFHTDARFSANPSGANPAGQILFGGSHTFAETVRTMAGGIYRLSSGATLEVRNVWDQRGSFENEGQISIADTGSLVNSGAFQSGSGLVRGSSSPFGGSIVNTPTGSFSSSIHAMPVPGGIGIERLNVVNQGAFTVTAGQEVLVRNFVNESGTVTVNGLVENSGGTFQLLGGVLGGNGVINGDAFIGGGPGVAVFNPGSSPGAMTIEGAFTLLPGGVLELEVQRDPLSGAILYDQVFAQSFFLDGLVSFLVGAGVTEADVLRLQFLDCGGACSMQYGADFSYQFPGRLGSSLSLSSDGIFISALAPIPEPDTVAMLLAGMGLIGMVVRRRRQRLRA